jgi:adenosylcobyric acid synthase
MAKAIMVQGTASGVGKTIAALALCRILKQDGHKVAPFKAQNITLNSALTPMGDEIAVSQLLQARAAGTEPDLNMNPILIKSVSGNTKVIVNCCSDREINFKDFSASKKELMPFIIDAYESLSKRYDVIVIEGAGSAVELNLKKNDIINMGLATRIRAPVLLVSNIDRGGVFAALYGTIMLLDECERKFVKATIINRFKGNISSYDEGVKIIEKITGRPVAGVIPYISFDLPEEDIPYNTESSQYSPDINFDGQFDLIADNFRKSLDMELIYKIINEGVENESK